MKHWRRRRRSDCALSFEISKLIHGMGNERHTIFNYRHSSLPLQRNNNGEKEPTHRFFFYSHLFIFYVHTQKREKKEREKKIGRPVSLSSPLVNEEDASITLTTFQSIDKPGAVLLLPRSYSCCLLILSSSCIKYRRITSNKSYRQKRESHRTLDDERDSSSF